MDALVAAGTPGVSVATRDAMGVAALRSPAASATSGAASLAPTASASAA
jgi:hypothetical protein